MPEDQLVKSQQIKLVWQMLQQLPQKQGEVLTLRYGLEGRNTFTRDQAGEELGLTSAQIRYAERQALKAFLGLD